MEKGRPEVLIRQTAELGLLSLRKVKLYKGSKDLKREH